MLGHLLLRRSLRPPGGQLLTPGVTRTVAGITVASVLAAGIATGVDRLLNLAALTTGSGGAGSMVRLAILTGVMLPIIVGVGLLARVPEAQAGVAAVTRRLNRGDRCDAPPPPNPDLPPPATPVT